MGYPIIGGWCDAPHLARLEELLPYPLPNVLMGGGIDYIDYLYPRILRVVVLQDLKGAYTRLRRVTPVRMFLVIRRLPCAQLPVWSPCL